MGYHFGQSYKEPKTRQEKLKGAKQNFIVALIFGAVAIGWTGYIQWSLKKEAEQRIIQTERTKKTQELAREIARSQGNERPQNTNTTYDPPPKGFGWDDVELYAFPVASGLVSLLMLGMGIVYIVEARRLPENG